MHVQCPECESGCSDCDHQGLICPYCGDSAVFCDALKCRAKEVAEPVPTLPTVVRPFVGPPKLPVVSRRWYDRPVGHRFPLGQRVRKPESSASFAVIADPIHDRGPSILRQAYEVWTSPRNADPIGDLRRGLEKLKPAVFGPTTGDAT